MIADKISVVYNLYSTESIIIKRLIFFDYCSVNYVILMAGRTLTNVVST